MSAQVLPPDPTDGVTAALPIEPAQTDTTKPYTVIDDWGGAHDPTLARLALTIAERQSLIDEFQGLVDSARQKFQERLEELGESKFECPVGVFSLAKNPDKLVVEADPKEMQHRFQKVTPDTKAIRQALEMKYPVQAHLEPPDQEYRLVVKLSK